MIPASITGHYAGPVSGILLPELQALLTEDRTGYLMSTGYYLFAEEHKGLWSLVTRSGLDQLSFCPHDVLVIYGKSIDIWRADDSEESRSYYLLNSIHFQQPVLSLIDALEEPLL
jgi:hypothetical protein